MRHLKVNSQTSSAGRRTIGTRNSKEIAAKNVQNDRNNIGKRIGTGSMPRTRRTVAQSTAGNTSVTSSNQNRIPKIQNGNDQPQDHGKMEALLKQRDQVMPCMTGSDRVANWKSSTRYAIGYYRNEVIVSPCKQSVQRSSIQERISYGKVSSSTTFDSHSSAYDFKVPSTVQRNDNSADLIDLTDDASESNTSSITTTQEELYSYLGVVTKSQTNKVETETENKTVKRSSLRVKVKQIALRNQEIYNQLENNRKLEAAALNNTQSLVRYNGHRIEQASVQVKRHNGDARLNQYTSQHQQYTQSTYKSTTLVNNTTNAQASRNNYRPVVTTNRVNQHFGSSNQLVPYTFRPSNTVRNVTNKCTVMERFVYKPKQETEPRSIQVNADKYKTAILSSATAKTTTVNRTTNGGRPPAINGDASGSKPVIVPSQSRPPQITAGIKRKAMEQWIELNSTRPTSSANHLPSKPNNSSTTTTTSSSFTSFHQQNVKTTTTNISTHRKVQKLDVSITLNRISNTVETNGQSSSASAVNNASPTRKIDTRKYAVQNGFPAQKLQQVPNTVAKIVPSAPISLSSPKIIRPANALALQTCSQKNIGNNRITKRRPSPKISDGLKKAIVNQAQTMQNVVVNNVVAPRKTQHSNVNINKGNPSSSMHMNHQKYVSVSSHKFPSYDMKVSSPPKPVVQNVSVNKVSSVQTSSQQYISSKDVAIEVTVHSNFNSKRSSSTQLRTTQNIATLPTENNVQQTLNRPNVMCRENIKSNKGPSSSVHNIITSNLSNQNKGSDATALKDEPIDESYRSNKMQTIESHANVSSMPTVSMKPATTFPSPVFDIQSDIQIASIASTDLNENVDDEDNKAEIPIDLSLTVVNDIRTAKRDTKTNSDDDIKPCLADTPIVSENSANESDRIESKSNVNESNFLQKCDGDVLVVLSFDDHFLVVQDKLISLWTLPSELFSIFGVSQRHLCTGKIVRYNCDIEIETPYQHRLLVLDNKTFYVELRAKWLTGTYTRESLMSVYLTLYSLNDEQELILRHIELDRVHGSIPSVRYTILPRSRSLVVCWYEGVTHIRRYNLNANMLNLESVLIFPGCRENMKKIQSFMNDAVIAFGHSTITMWNSRTGDITCKIDTNTPIGDNLHFYSLSENTERVLFLVQSCSDTIGPGGQLIKLMAIKMNKNYAWKIIATHKMPLNGAKITSTATMSKHFIAFYETGQSFLLNLYNPRQFVVHSSEAKGSKYFVTNEKIIAIDHNQLIAKTFVDHFFG